MFIYSLHGMLSKRCLDIDLDIEILQLLAVMYNIAVPKQLAIKIKEFFLLLLFNGIGRC